MAKKPVRRAKPLTRLGFREAVRQTKKFLEAHPDAEWDSFAQEIIDEAPGWDDSWSEATTTSCPS
jgi:hypothetical protein